MSEPVECSGVSERLPEYLAGRLSAEEEDAVRSHLEACPDCRERAKAVSLLQQTPVPAPDPERWSHFTEGVVEAAGRRGRRRWRIWLPIAAAGAALLLLLWTPLGERRPDEATLDELARSAVELSETEAAAWSVGVVPGGWMTPGIDVAGLAPEEIEQVSAEVNET